MWSKGRQLWVADRREAKTMTYSKQGMRDFQGCDKSMGNVNGVTFPIKGPGKLSMLLQTRNSQWMEVILTDVACVPLINDHLLSLNSVIDKGHEYVGRRDGITVHLGGGGEIYCPPHLRLRAVREYMLDQLQSPAHAHAVIVPA